jgi:hypothetical protein
LTPRFRPENWQWPSLILSVTQAELALIVLAPEIGRSINNRARVRIATADVGAKGCHRRIVLIAVTRENIATLNTAS